MQLHLCDYLAPMPDFPHPTPETTAAWTRLIRASSHVLGQIDSALKAAQMPPLGWYDALWEIEQAGPDGIRPFQLEQRLLLPQYGLSRLIDRMVRDGLLLRREVAGDGRGQVLHLTDKGRDTRARMWPVYATALDANIARNLSQTEAADLARLLSRLYPPRTTS